MAEFIVEMIEWRKEQGEGLSELCIPQWMHDVICHEWRCKAVKSIDNVQLRVLPDSHSAAVLRGLSLLSSEKEKR